MGEECFTVKQYRDEVIELFKSGKATDEQWDAMASILNDASENTDFDPDEHISPIDDTILGKKVACGNCDTQTRPRLRCWQCDEWPAEPGR